MWVAQNVLALASSHLAPPFEWAPLNNPPTRKKSHQKYAGTEEEKDFNNRTLEETGFETDISVSFTYM